MALPTNQSAQYARLQELAHQGRPKCNKCIDERPKYEAHNGTAWCLQQPVA